MSNEPEPAAADAREIIARSCPEDYDGHTEFQRLLPGERLAWLDAAVVFIEADRKAVPQSWAVADERSEPPARS